MALNDMYELVAKMTFDGRTRLNVYHVVRDVGTMTAENIAQAFIDTVQTDWLAAVNSAVVAKELEVRNIGDPLDFTVASLGDNNGAIAGEALPAHDTFSIQFNRKRLDMNHGYKRLCGVSEGDQSGGDLTGAAITRLQTFATTLMSNWEEASAPGVTVCNFVVIKRIEYTPDPAQPTKTAYRLPESDAELVFYQPSASSANFVGTQNSRKRVRS